MSRDLTSYRSASSVWDFMSEVEKAFDEIWTPQQPITKNQTFNSTSKRELATFAPPVDLHETPEFYLISLDMPGIAQKDIRIDVSHSRLTVSGERTREEHKSDGMFKRFERSVGRFERSFQLPQNIEEGKIQARTENGVLEIMIPKAAAQQQRTIKIEADSKSGLFSNLLGKKNVEAAAENEKSANKESLSPPPAEKH